jgi:hypothetical protein
LTERNPLRYPSGQLEPVIDLAPGADTSRLALRLASLFRENLARHPQKQADLQRMRGAICLIADDTREALTLRFDYGRLMLHLGVVGVPDVTLRAPAGLLAELQNLPSPTMRGAVALATSLGSRRSLAGAARALGRGELKVYGLVLHAPLVGRFWRLLSTQA